MEADLAVKLISVHLCVQENFDAKSSIHPGMCSKCYCRRRSLGPGIILVFVKRQVHVHGHRIWMVKDLHQPDTS